MRTLSKGIWRDVYVTATATDSAAIVHVAPLVFYNGPYPTNILADYNAGPWTVSVRVLLFVASGTGGAHGKLDITGEWGGEGTSGPLSINEGETIVTVNITVEANTVALWWPNGIGGQTMYNLNVTFTSNVTSLTPIIATRRIGFRTFTIVTADDTDPESIAGKDGSGTLMVRWKINGANLFARGADVIPMENMEGRQTDVAYKSMIASAAAAGFNTLRVDGIDLYFPDVFYKAADEFGLLVYHDMQYSQGNVFVAETPLQTAEILHTVRRLASHPSIVIYDGCNECGGHSLIASFVMTTVAQEDPSRSPWPASPSNGWITGVDRLTSLPNNSPLGLQPTLKLLVPVHHSENDVGNSASGTCTFYTGLDICPGTAECMNLPHMAAANSGECCAICDAAGLTKCGAAVWYNGVCWFKPLNASIVTSQSETILVWPSSRGPLPPSPPPSPPPPYSQREVHGPYQHGTGFPAVNGDPSLSLFNSNIPPTFGPSFIFNSTTPGFFVSEFGCVATSSFESMSPTLDAKHWSLHGGSPPDDCVGGFFRNCSNSVTHEPSNVMAQRNYPMDSIIASYFGVALLPSLDDVGVFAFKRQLYLAMLSTALQQKSHVETLRAAPTWGIVIWQLNEVWPTGGWGSVEYGVDDSSFTSGSVSGGRWKILHHWLETILYRDVIAGCGSDSRCFIRNDSPRLSVEGTVDFQFIHIASGDSVRVGGTNVSLPIGGGSIAWTCLGGEGEGGVGCKPLATLLAQVGCAVDGSDCAAQAIVTNNTTAILCNNLIWLAPPSQLNFTRGLDVTASVGVYDSSLARVPVNVTVTGGGAALFVMLTTLAQGRFQDNGIPLLVEGVFETYFIPILAAEKGGRTIDVTLLASSIRVEHLGMYV